MGEPVLLGVEHHEAMAHGQRVHARAGREVAPGLAAAVQHDHERQLLAGRELQVGRAKQVKAARAARAHGHAAEPVALAGRRLEPLGRGALHLAGDALAVAQRDLGQRAQVALVRAGEDGSGGTTGHGAV
jgi:hypothetical protein